MVQKIQYFLSKCALKVTYSDSTSRPNIQTPVGKPSRTITRNQPAFFMQLFMRVQNDWIRFSRNNLIKDFFIEKGTRYKTPMKRHLVITIRQILGVDYMVSNFFASFNDN